MEIKKSAEANLEDKRTSFVALGTLFISSLTLVSFTFRAPEEDKGASTAGTRELKITAQEETPPPPPPNTPPPPQTQMEVPPTPQEEIKEEENTETEPTGKPTPPPPPLPQGPPKVEIVKEIIEFPDVEAQFPGGAAAMQRWIVDNVQYPQASIEMNEQGRVFLSFVVEEDGSITNIAVMKGVSRDLDNEAKRLLRNMPKWIPGESKGEKARVRCQIPINFTLN